MPLRQENRGERSVTMNDGEILRSLLDAAIAAAQPEGKFDGRLPPRPKGRTIVLGAGKAAANMASAFEAAWGPCEGLIVTRYGHRTPTRFVEVVEASHPVPDEAGLAAADRILALARSAGPGRSRGLPDVGRRLGAADPPGRRGLVRDQAGHQPGLAELGRADQAP